MYLLLTKIPTGSYKDKNDPDHGSSFYTFGYLDETALAGQTPYYTSIDNSQGFWQFKSTTASINGKKITRSGNTAIADTGTTLALVDDNLCQAIYDAIPGAKYDEQQQGYLFPSNTTVDKLPVVAFDVGGKEFAVQKEDLAFADAGNNMTYGGIQSRGDLSFDILGDTWLKAIYAVSFPYPRGVLGMLMRIFRYLTRAISALGLLSAMTLRKILRFLRESRRGISTFMKCSGVLEWDRRVIERGFWGRVEHTGVGAYVLSTGTFPLFLRIPAVF